MCPGCENAGTTDLSRYHSGPLLQADAAARSLCGAAKKPGVLGLTSKRFSSRAQGNFGKCSWPWPLLCQIQTTFHD